MTSSFARKHTKMSKRVTRIDIIRHGEPEGGEVFRGRTNHLLTAKGRNQFAERLARNDAKWAHIISSPMSRCQESAAMMAKECGITHEIDPRWVEIDYGDWEDKLIAEVMSAEYECMQQLWQDPLNFCAPNGESVPDLQARVVEGWNSLISKHHGEHVLVVTHGGVMRVLAQHLLSLAPEAMNRLSIPYAGFMRFRIDHSDSQGSDSQGSDSQGSENNEHWVSLERLDGDDLFV